jgi:hypothetical protein
MELERLVTDYDDGYFDKDEQGWCARRVRVRLEGAQVIVELSGDDNGLRPYARTFAARLVEVDPSSDLAVLASPQGRVFFDLARRRLVSGRPAQLRTTAAARPGLVLGALVAEAKEVGSMLSWLDHGGGDEAWARIARAEEAASALGALFPDALVAAGVTELAAAFAKGAPSRWTALDDLGRSPLLAELRARRTSRRSRTRCPARARPPPRWRRPRSRSCPRTRRRSCAPRS